MRIFLPQTLRRYLTNLLLRWVLIVPFVLYMIGAITLIGYLSERNGQNSVEILADRLVAQTIDRIIQELNSYLQIPILINCLNVDAVDRKWLILGDNINSKLHTTRTFLTSPNYCITGTGN